MTQIEQLKDRTLNQIAKEMLTAWQENHGAKNGQTYAINGINFVVVLFEDAFTQAELHLAEQEMGQNDTLNRYVNCLLDHICREQKPAIEEIIGRNVISTSVNADPSAGWAMCLFKLMENAETSGSPV